MGMEIKKYKMRIQSWNIRIAEGWRHALRTSGR